MPINDDVRREAQRFQLGLQKIGNAEVWNEDVRRHSDETYKVPSHWRKFISNDVDHLEGLLKEMKGINDEFEGEPRFAASLALNGNPEALAISDGFIAWVDGYIEERAKKRNPRDEGNPLRKYDRIIRSEVTSFLANLAGLRHSVHLAFMSRVHDHFPWALWQATWRGWMIPTPNGYKPRPSVPPNTGEAAMRR